MNLVKEHPNATVGGLAGGSGLGTAVVWALDHWQYANDWSPYAKTAIAGGVAAVVLFVGRNGIIGTYTFLKHLILHGSGHQHEAEKRGHHSHG